MTYRVELAPLAENDFEDIGHWIADEAGVEFAQAYLARIRQKLARLNAFPNRGTQRDDLGPNVRTLVFERSLIIVYRVMGDVVRIERVVSGRRELRGII